MLKNAPNTRRNLDIAIMKLASSEAGAVRLRTTMANTIVAQIMPEGAVKGGSSLKMRFGEAATRFTTDFDTARSIGLEEFVSRFSENLAQGWNGFTGRIVRREPASPEGVPPRYIMQPYDIKLDYRGRPWCTVGLEIGHDEIGDADEPDYILDESIVRVFRELALPVPDPVALMPLHHQIAQKLHGASEVGSRRAHDLIDLQIIIANGEINWAETKRTCERLFSYRREQVWPPKVTANDRWDDLYASQAKGIDVLQDVGEAVAWANDLIARINSEE